MSAPDLALAFSPRVADAIGDVARPRAGLPVTRDIDHLPGERGLVAGMRNLHGWLRRGNAHLVEQRHRFGPVYRTWMMRDPIVCVADPALVLQMVRNEDRSLSAALAWRVFFEGLDTTSDTLDSLTTFDFEAHREVRKLLQPAFGAAATAGYVETAAPMFERAVDGWLARGRVAFKPAIRRLLADVSSRTLLGVEDEREGERLDRALAAFWAAPFALTKNRWLSPTWRHAMDGHRVLREAFRAQVAARRTRGGADLFSRLCSESRGVDWLDDDGTVRLFIGLMAGAFDTTSSGLTSMAYLLARHPEWQERLREEALSTARGRVTYEQIARMTDAELAWKESLRLFPVAPDLPRRALRDMTLGGWSIPAGAFLLAMIAPVMQDPSWWTHPQRFDPERFAEGRAEDKRHKGLYLPFGAGAHACIGSHLANVEVKAFWHTMLTRCRFRLERDYEGAHTFTPLGIVSGDVRIVLEPLRP